MNMSRECRRNTSSKHRGITVAKDNRIIIIMENIMDKDKYIILAPLHTIIDNFIHDLEYIVQY